MLLECGPTRLHAVINAVSHDPYWGRPLEGSRRRDLGSRVGRAWSACVCVVVGCAQQSTVRSSCQKEAATVDTEMHGFGGPD